MGYPYVAEAGATPMIIGSTGAERQDGVMGGGSVLVILLFIIVIAVVAIPLMRNREPIASGGALESILPAMMISNMNRNNIDVNSNNTGTVNCGPTNFDLYQQGCLNNKTTIEQGQATRELINSTEISRLKDQIASMNLAMSQKDTSAQLTGLFSAQTVQSLNQFDSIQRQITQIQNDMFERPKPAYCVSPYGAYQRNNCSQNC